MQRVTSQIHRWTLSLVIAAMLTIFSTSVYGLSYTKMTLPVPSGGSGTISVQAYALNNLTLTNSALRVVGVSSMSINGSVENVACYWKYASGSWTGTFLPTGAPTGYTFVSSEARGVNNAKKIVGDYTYKQNAFPYATYTHACYWILVSGVYQLTDLGTLGGSNSYARGVNTVGDIVGYSDLANGNSHASYWKYDSTTIYNLGTLGGNNSAGLAINDSKDITGWADDSSGTQWAIIGTPDVNHIPDILTSLGTVNDSGYTVDTVVGTALNNRFGTGTGPDIVGWNNGPTGSGRVDPFFDTIGVGPVEIPASAGADSFSYAQGVNNGINGAPQRVVGYFDDNRGDGLAWYWDYGTSGKTELPETGAAEAWAINDYNTVAGSDGTGATVWTWQ